MKAEYETIAKEQYCVLSDGSELRILQTKATEKTRTKLTLFIIPGWATIIPSWDNVLMEAKNFFNIVYCETREKGSSKLVKKTKTDLNRHSADIQEIITQLNLDQKKLILLASSFGAMIAAHGLSHKKINPLLTVLVGVTSRIDLPPTTRYLIPISPPFVFTMFKPIAKFWIKKFKSEDKKQADKYLRVLEEADAKKWKAAAKLIMPYWHWDIYEKITSNVLVIGAEKDKMHDVDQTKKIYDLIKNASYIDMGTNKDVYSKKFVTVLREFIESINV